MSLPLEVVQIELVKRQTETEETLYRLIIRLNSTNNRSHFTHVCLLDATTCDNTADTSSINFGKQASISPSRNVGADNTRIAPTCFHFDLSETQFNQLKSACYRLRIRLAEGRPIQEQSKCTLEFELRNGHYYKEQTH